MYTFTEYFDEEKISKGYEGGMEHLGDLLLLLDMALECFLRDKGKRCREKTWHSRGTMVSEEEIQDYFDLPPFLRQDDRVSHEAMEDAGKARDYIRKREALTKEAFLPMAKVREELSLSFSEELTLLLALSIRLDLKYLRIYRFMQDDYTLKFPTRGTALALLSYLGLPSEGLFSPDSTLMRFLLDRREDERMRPTPPLLEPLLLSDPAASYLLGEEGETDLPLLVQREAEGYEGFFQRALEGLLKDRPHPGKASFRYIESADPEDVSYALLSLAKMRKEPYYEIDVRRLKGGEKLLRALTFYLRMHEGVLLLKEEKPEEPDQEGIFLPEYSLGDLLPVFFKALPGRMIYLCGEKKLPPLSVPVEATPAVLSLPLPEVKERIRIWQYFLAAEGILLEDNIDILDVADCHELSFSAIRRILRQARETMDSRGEETLPRSLLQELLFRLNTSHFDNLASAVEVRYTWEDIFLGSAEKKRLKAACDRFRLRNRVGAEWGITRKNAYGNAVIILMYGPPGTGKTMAAQAIANEVMTPLYRVDVSQIFSKYIGETQKNLSRIFDEAEKRSVVPDARPLAASSRTFGRRDVPPANATSAGDS